MIKRKRAVEEEETKLTEAALKGGPPALSRAKSSYEKSAADLRLDKDFEELDLPKNVVELKLINPNDKKRFELFFDLTKEDSYWKGGKYKFTVTVENDYPIKPPKVHCDTPVYHPNIDT